MIALESNIDFALRALDCPLGEKLWRPTLLMGVDCDVLAEKSLAKELSDKEIRTIVAGFNENVPLVGNWRPKTIYRRIFQNDRAMRICYDAQVAQHIRIPRKDANLEHVLDKARRKNAGRERLAVYVWENHDWELEYDFKTRAKNRYDSSLSEGKIDLKCIFGEIVDVVRYVRSGGRLLPKDMQSDDPV